MAIKLRAKGDVLNAGNGGGFFFLEGQPEGRPAAKEVLLLDSARQDGSYDLSNRQWGAVLATRDVLTSELRLIKAIGLTAIKLRPDRVHLGKGDVVHLDPTSGNVGNAFRADSNDNSILITEECNSNCIMCSQPPRVDGVEGRIGPLLELVSLIPRSCQNIGLTGGEPLLLGRAFLRLLEAVNDSVAPTCAVHILSNGRLFYYPNIASDVADVSRTNVMFGVPLYSDSPQLHDYVTQSPGSFRETMVGLHNLASYGVNFEVRMVVQKSTTERLVRWAEYVARNLPMAAHVALMGLEIMGHTNRNRNEVWIDPADYMGELRAACDVLRLAGIPFSIYNLPLCVLDPDLWPWARQSISDWKNDFFPACDECAVKGVCSGAFTSGLKLHSRSIRAFSEKPTELDRVGSR